MDHPSDISKDETGRATDSAEVVTLIWTGSDLHWMIISRLTHISAGPFTHPVCTGPAVQAGPAVVTGQTFRLDVLLLDGIGPTAGVAIAAEDPAEAFESTLEAVDHRTEPIEAWFDRSATALAEPVAPAQDSGLDRIVGPWTSQLNDGERAPCRGNRRLA